MAVEAGHVNLSNQQRNLVNSMNGFVYNREMGENIFPIDEQIIQVQPNTCESGLTFNQQRPTKDRKRSRDHSFTPSFVPLLQQYNYLDIISHHTKKIRLELEEQQQHEARMLVAAIGERVMNKMKEKDEEIERMGKMNLFLQERIKSLHMENQLWRDLAHNNEATANWLRSNLEQLLAHRVVEEDQVESCSNEEEEEGKKDRMCRRCGERESCVLLLPCRHLCLCTRCASTLQHACPLCNSNMNATLHVNIHS